MDDVLDVMNAESCGKDAKLHWLLDVFKGYRAPLDDPNPYSPGGARAGAWAYGRDLKEKDQK